MVCSSVAVKWLAVKTASEMTYTVSGGALNSTQSNPIQSVWMCVISVLTMVVSMSMIVSAMNVLYGFVS